MKGGGDSRCSWILKARILSPTASLGKPSVLDQRVSASPRRLHWPILRVVNLSGKCAKKTQVQNALKHTLYLHYLYTSF